MSLCMAGPRASRKVFIERERSGGEGRRMTHMLPHNFDKLQILSPHCMPPSTSLFLEMGQ